VVSAAREVEIAIPEAKIFEADNNLVWREIFIISFIIIELIQRFPLVIYAGIEQI
jgi:hypothetical protein